MWEFFGLTVITVEQIDWEFFLAAVTYIEREYRRRREEEQR